MDYHKTGYTFLIWIMSVLYFICNISLVDGVRFYRSYRSYRTYYTYTYYYSYSYYDSYTLSTGAIVGIVIGALIGGAIFCTGCVLCCVCMCGNSKKATSGQVITTNQLTVSTITASQMTSNVVNHEPPVYYSSSPQYSQGQYNTEYSAPPPRYDDLTDPGKVNSGFRNPT